jgi:predicted N-acetyltransferase YhbS
VTAEGISACASSRAQIGEVGSDARRAGVARELFREYQVELGIDLGFQGFEAEVASLPGPYAPPSGCLLLADLAGRPVGCVGLRPIGPGVAGLKRLFVRTDARGRGIARDLAWAALAHARAQRYERVVLDTLSTMAAAQRLYRSLGFRETEPYTVNPVPGARFMALDLGTRAPTRTAGKSGPATDSSAA